MSTTFKGASGTQTPLSSNDLGPKKFPRFSEPAKFAPVIFVCMMILCLFWIYTVFHLWPMFQLGVDTPMHNSRMRYTAIGECIVFLYCTLMLVICYVKSILVHPGEIPDRDQDPYWTYEPQDGHQLAHDAPNIQESKRSGERRYCKWCAKYKPDRCHHCRVCRTCILKMDHHCPWIYNCVGFRNHKFFFLLLLYSALDSHLVMWSMLESVTAALRAETPFLTLFWLLLGETISAFLVVLLTVFFSFHVWLMTCAMTTIEFCEKSLKKTGYDSSVYHQGACGNVKAVLGSQPLLWLIPVSTPVGDGMNFVGEHSRLTANFTDPGRSGLRRVVHRKMGARAKGTHGGHDAKEGGGHDGGLTRPEAYQPGV